MTKSIRQIIESWEKSYIEVDAMLQSVRSVFPQATADEIGAAAEEVARGAYSPASACAAATLCHLHGLGDPLDRAAELYNSTESERELPEPVWFLWAAGSTYNLISNSGLSACYYEFEERQYADRIRAYEAIGAKTAAAVMAEADQAFGAGGPPPAVEDRSAYYSEEAAPILEELAPRFWACDDEIFTRSFLYALDHAELFRKGD